MLPFRPNLKSYPSNDRDVRRQIDRHNDVAIRAIGWIEDRVCRSGPQQFNFRDIADGIGASLEAVRAALPHDNANGVTFWLTEEALEKVQIVARERATRLQSRAIH